MKVNEIIKKPVITEKSIAQTALGRYLFEVDKRANKRQIAQAVETLFGVHVVKVNTVIVKGKKKRSLKSRVKNKRSDWKKAAVQLKEGEKIEAFDLGE